MGDNLGLGYLVFPGNLKPVSFLKLIFLASSAFLFTACLEESGKVSVVDFQELVEEKASLKQELRRVQDELAEYEEQLEASEKQGESLERDAEESEKLRKKNEKLEQELHELRKEYADYQKKYEAAVREKAIGEKIASLKIGEQIFKNLEIQEISETEIRLRHDFGFANLNYESAPKDLKERFFIRSEKEVAQRAADIAQYTTASKGDDPNKASSEKSEDSEKGEGNEQVAKKDGITSNKALLAVPSTVLIISGNGGQGTGFFAREGTKTYLYTAAHVLDRNTNLKIVDSKGKEWRNFGPFEVAKGLDLARLEVNEPVDDFLNIRRVGAALEIGTQVAAFGNANGGGVITEEGGELKGVGPTSYEISSAILQGNSGGPVVDAEGEVVAVVTHLLRARDDVWAKGTPSAEVRRFACRIDANVEWVTVSLGRFVASQEVIDKYDRVTRLLFAMSALTPTTEGLYLDTELGGSQTVQDILNENASDAVVKEVLKINAELVARKLKVSESDLKKKFRNFFNRIAGDADRQSLSPIYFSPYHQTEVEASLEFRERAREAMSEAIRNIR